MLNTDTIRKDFPILKRQIHDHPLVYLDNAATTQKPVQVIESMVDYYSNHNANVHRGVHTLSEEATRMGEIARGKVAKFINARSEREVIFVRNASEAINLVMYTFGEANIKAGEAIVISLMEHHSNLVTWQVLAKKKGAELRVVDVDKEGKLILEGGEMRIVEGIKMGSLEELLDEKVKLVAITAVSNMLGTINPVKEIVKKVKEKSKAKVLVDGSQSVPHMRTDVQDLGVDFLVFSGHKMLGPMGIGVLWGKQELLEEMSPFLYGGDMISEVRLGGASWNQLPFKFEAGTPNVEGMVGLGAAIDYLEKIGMEEVREHEKELIEYGLERFRVLEEEGLIEIYGPRDAAVRGGVLTFNVNGVHGHDVAQVLDRYGIAVRSGQHCAQPLTESVGQVATVRASFYIYNNKEDIDYLFRCVPQVLSVLKV